MVSCWKPSFTPARCLAAAAFRRVFALLLIAAGLLGLGASFAQAQASTFQKRRIPRTLPRTRFYDTAQPLPAGKPGDLIRAQALDEYELPYSVSAVRILYHSRSAAGEDVASSGVVLFPYDKKPPAGGWPIIAWAHGATGVARACAPSLTKNLGHGPFLAMYVNLGYAVVAPDYTGLGTDFRNAFADGPSNSADLIASIPAARAAVLQLGTRWVVMGDAEGSLAALAVAEKESQIPDPAYLGSIAISGLASPQEMFGNTALGLTSFTLASLAYGIKTIYPEFQPGDILTEKGVALYREIGQICWEAEASAVPSPAETVKPGWTDNPFVRQYFARSSVAQARTHAPLLLITGDDDPLAPVAAQTVAALCKQGDLIDWQHYPGVETGVVIGDSVREQISWIEARFAGRSAPTTCR